MMEKKESIVPAPEVIKGIYNLIFRTYELLNDVYNYGATREGVVLSNLDYQQKIDDSLNEVVSTLQDCIGEAISIAAQNAVMAKEPNNNLNFVPDERK